MSKKKTKAGKKPMSRRSKFTIFAMINIVWYTVVVLVASFKDHLVPSELTYAWFSAWTAELALLFGIKVKTLKHDNFNDSECNGYSASYDENYSRSQDPNYVSDYDEELG